MHRRAGGNAAPATAGASLSLLFGVAVVGKVPCSAAPTSVLQLYSRRLSNQSLDRAPKAAWYPCMVSLGDRRLPQAGGKFHRKRRCIFSDLSIDLS